MKEAVTMERNELNDAGTSDLWILYSDKHTL